jgi:hypothetical protein
MEKVPTGKLMEMVCAWKGCGHTILVGDILPAGWKCIIVTRSSLFDKKSLMLADVDGVLCPEHFAELRSYLKIGQEGKE